MKLYEDAIASYGLKEFAEAPLTLFILIESFSDILQEKKNQQITKVRRHQLYQNFVNRSIKVAVERFLSSKNLSQEEDKDSQQLLLLFENLKRQLENLALRLSGYRIQQDDELKLEDSEENVLLLSSCPLLKKIDETGSSETFVFSHKSFQDYFVAPKIETEILRNVNPDQPEISYEWISIHVGRPFSC